jgi:calcineurin-like phosphoesterase family protein
MYSNENHKFNDSEVFNCDNIYNTYVISDTHFFHRKIQEYTDRPDDWSDKIIKNWNNIIKPDDLVLHLGDLSFGSKPTVMKITRRLNGRKYLLQGNHDRRSKKWFDDVGFTLIKKSFMVDCKEHLLLFTHRPTYGIPKGTINIHGHIHNTQHFIKHHKNVTHINVSVEKTDYRPIKIGNLLWRADDKSKSRIIV